MNQGDIDFFEVNAEIARFLDREIHIALTSKPYRLVFNPQSGGEKIITFLPDGKIGAGSNSNEYMWRVSDGRLEIVQSNGALHSRFVFDRSTQHFAHTNDPDTRSIKGQRLIPLEGPAD